MGIGETAEWECADYLVATVDEEGVLMKPALEKFEGALEPQLLLEIGIVLKNPVEEALFFKSCREISRISLDKRPDECVRMQQTSIDEIADNVVRTRVESSYLHCLSGSSNGMKNAHRKCVN